MAAAHQDHPGGRDPEGLLLREEVDEVIAPGEEGYFGVLPGHTPFLATLGLGEITYRAGRPGKHLTCFWGFCEVLPDRVNILAEVGERAGGHRRRARGAGPGAGRRRMKAIRDEAGYAEAHAGLRQGRDAAGRGAPASRG